VDACGCDGGTGQIFDGSKNKSAGRTVMGSYLGKDMPMIKLNGKMVRSKAFHEIQTYKDALRIAEIYVPDDAQLTAIDKDKRVIVFAYERFQIVDGIYYNDKTLYIEKLYGRR
jgi:hypothetical protein